MSHTGQNPNAHEPSTTGKDTMTKTCKKCGLSELSCKWDGCKKFVAENDKVPDKVVNDFIRKGLKKLEKPQKGCGKIYDMGLPECRDGNLCPSCSGNHTRLPDGGKDKLTKVYPAEDFDLSERKLLELILKKIRPHNIFEDFTDVLKQGEVMTARYIFNGVDLRQAIQIMKDREETLIKIGDKIFYAEDYADDKVPHDMFIYAQGKWDKLKKFVGEELSK